MSHLAKTIYYNYKVYQEWLSESNLDDDSNDISVEDLQDFVENYIDEEDYERLLAFVQKRPHYGITYNN